MTETKDNVILFALILQDKEFISEELGEINTTIKFNGITYFLDSRFIQDIDWMAEVLGQKDYIKSKLV